MKNRLISDNKYSSTRLTVQRMDSDNWINQN